MNILHIVPTYFPAYRYGGPIESVHALNSSLVKEGVKVTVFTTDKDGSGRLDVKTGIPHTIDGVEVWYFRSSFPQFWFYSRDLRRALKAKIKEFDVIHITSVFLTPSTLGAYYARKFKKPYIISPRGSLMVAPLAKSSLKKSLYISFIEKRNLRNANAIHFTTMLEKEEYMRASLPVSDAIVIPNSLNIENLREIEVGGFREKYNIDKDKKVVLFLGRLSWKKGFDTLIPAFKKVCETISSATLVITGGDDEGYKSKIQTLVANCQLQNNVVFTGALGRNEKVLAYRESDLFVLPSYSENFAMAVIEAMYFELPVIISKAVGISDEVKSAQAGIVIDKNVDECADAIIRILQDNVDSKKMGENGKRLVEEKFDQSKIAKEWIREYNKILL